MTHTRPSPSRAAEILNDSPRILIVDDDRAFRIGTGALLTDEGYRVDVAASGDEGLKRLSDGGYDLVLLDLKMEGRTGLSVLEEIRRTGNPIPVLMLTGYATVDTAVQALKLGADDYITKPCDNHALRSKIRVILARRAPVLGPGASPLVGRSAEMKSVFKAIEQVAPTDSTVLVRGATGTGKELVARAIHEESTRRGRPFLPVNCSALSEGVLESELFGHARGAFTGAVSERKGLFEAAEGGTIFLDEIGDVGASVQAKLLRVLQEKEVMRVGTATPLPVDVRVIAATHRDLEEMVEQGSFRADLYFRLKVFQIHVPDLKERPGDIPMLASAALDRWNDQARSPTRRIGGFSDETLAVLEAYDWPGNVRELMAAIEHACIVCDGPRILPCHLPADVREPDTDLEDEAGTITPIADAGRRYQAPDPADERAAILTALEAASGNRTRAAALLGMGRTTLWQKLKVYGLEQY